MKYLTKKRIFTTNRVKHQQKVRGALFYTIAAIMLSACAALMGRETACEYTNDAEITDTINSKILQDSELKAYQIHVETFRQHVQLSGFVGTLREAERAIHIAKAVEGAKDVKNNLTVSKN